MALNSKRMQTFFNEFLITTTTFLNQFANECEDKFFELERKLNKIESNLVIIEQKLASVPTEENSIPKNLPLDLPEVDALKVTSTNKEPDNPKDNQSEKNDMEKTEQEINQKSEPGSEPSESETANTNLIKISESSAYKKYFKMLKFGIPVQAVKLKMSSEGMDSNLLDNSELLVEKSPEDNEENQ